MEFLSDYLGGDISEDEFNDDVFTVTKVGSDEKDYKTMEDFINSRLKIGADEYENEDEDVIDGVFAEDFTEDIVEGAFEDTPVDDIKSEIDDLLKKLE